MTLTASRSPFKEAGLPAPLSDLLQRLPSGLPGRVGEAGPGSVEVKSGWDSCQCSERPQPYWWVHASFPEAVNNCEGLCSLRESKFLCISHPAPPGRLAFRALRDRAVWSGNCSGGMRARQSVKDDSLTPSFLDRDRQRGRGRKMGRGREIGGGGVKRSGSGVEGGVRDRHKTQEIWQISEPSCEPEALRSQVPWSRFHPGIFLSIITLPWKLAACFRGWKMSF